MRFVAVSLFFVLSMTLSVNSQNLQIEGLDFEVASYADATAKLGKPKKEKIDSISFRPAVPGESAQRKNVRKLIYEDVNGWKQVELSFIDDKLVTLMFWPKNKTLKAAELLKMADADFLLVEGFAKGVSLASFEGQKETNIPKVYPARYHMVAVKPDRYIISLINNGSFKAILKDGFRKPTIELFPGYIENVVIQSRALEKK